MHGGRIWRPFPGLVGGSDEYVYHAELTAFHAQFTRQPANPQDTPGPHSVPKPHGAIPAEVDLLLGACRMNRLPVSGKGGSRNNGNAPTILMVG